VKRSTWILLAIVLALAAVIVFWERKQPSTDEAAQKKEKLAGLAAAGVTSLARAGQDPLTLVKDDNDRWKLTAPVEDSADRYAVEGFLGRLAELKVIRWVDAPSNLEELGLQPPKAVWKIQGPSPLTLDVGGEAALKEGLYLRAAGRVALVPSDLESLLLRPASQFRSKNLTAAATQEIRACSVSQGGKETLAFKRSAAGGWDLTAPVRDWGDAAKIENLLDDVSLCLVDSYADDHPKDLKAYGLDPPATFVRLELTKAPAVEVRLGSPVPGSDASKGLVYAWASGRPSVMTVSLNGLKSLAQDPEGLRSPGLWRHDFFDVQEIRFQGKAALALKRGKDGAWEFEEGRKPSGKADAAGLVGALQSLRGEKVLSPPAAARAGEPLLTAVLKGKEFEEKTAFAAGSEGSVWAMPAGRSAVLPVPKEEWARFEAALKLDAPGGKP
jgi:hypothetical protein